MEIYQHLLEAVPSMRAQNEYPQQGGGQRYDQLLGLASDGLSFLSGPPPPSQPQIQQNNVSFNPEPTSVPLNATISSGSNKRPALGVNGDKKTPKCLGCGATETPEWRRGPLGPRTLCNACVSSYYFNRTYTDIQGLVHMKLQRKKRKELEKEVAREIR